MEAGPRAHMSAKRTRDALSVIREFAKTPKRSLPTPRRVPVDSNGNEIAKTPRRISRTSVSKSLPQGLVSLRCNTPSKTPCQLQVSPDQERNHLISSKLNEDHLSSGACTPRELKPSNISSHEVKTSHVLFNSEISSEKENILMVNDEFSGKEDTPFKGKMFADRNTSARKERILSLLSRFQKRENFVRSPALRVEIKDSIDDCGKRRKLFVSKSSMESNKNQFQQCRIQKRDNFVRSPALRVEIKDSMDDCGKRRKLFVSKSSTESNKKQFQQCRRTDGNVGKKIDTPKRSTKSHINKSDAAKRS